MVQYRDLDLTNYVEQVTPAFARRLETKPIPRADKAVLLDQGLGPFEVELRGVLWANSEAELETLRRNFAQAMGEEGEAKLYLEAGFFYLARVVSWGLSLESGTPLGIPFTARLAGRSPFRYSDTLQSVGMTNNSATINYGGNYKTIPTITVQAEADISTFSVSDGTRTVTVTVTLAAGESAVIGDINDVVPDLSVWKGNTQIYSYAGQFPELWPGNNTLTYSGPTATVTVQYRERFL